MGLLTLIIKEKLGGWSRMGVGSTVSRFQEALGGDFILTENRANKSSASGGDKRWRHRKAGGNLLPPAHQRSNYSNTADPGDDLNTAEQATCTWGGGDHPEKGAVWRSRGHSGPQPFPSPGPQDGGRRTEHGGDRGLGTQELCTVELCPGNTSLVASGDLRDGTPGRAGHAGRSGILRRSR